MSDTQTRWGVGPEATFTPNTTTSHVPATTSLFFQSLDPRVLPFPAANRPATQASWLPATVPGPLVAAPVTYTPRSPGSTS